MEPENQAAAKPSELNTLLDQRANELQSIHDEAQAGLMHPAHQVWFRAGLLACREYMARFVEAESACIAQSIRANWWPDLGPDPGTPRQNDWAELTDGECGEADFRVRGPDEVSPSIEALPVALSFLLRSNAPAQPPSAPQAKTR